MAALMSTYTTAHCWTQKDRIFLYEYTYKTLSDLASVPRHLLPSNEKGLLLLNPVSELNTYF